MKIKVHLFGKHSNRTPLSYSAYSAVFDKHIDFTNDPLAADYIVSGFNIDFRDNAETVQIILSKNPDVKFVVFSEEPLWDTIWSGAPSSIDAEIQLKTCSGIHTLKYKFISHLTSSIFRFEKLPYFITTSDDFFIRYLNLFHRNSKWSNSDIRSLWSNAPIDCAFIAARRPSPSFDISLLSGQVLGLNRFRTLVAERVATQKNVYLEGLGWGTDIARQTLPDWHLDKLAMLDKKCRVVSALENTHVADYISEKLFDAYAVLAAPIYHALPGHRALELVNPSSFINTAGLSADEAADSISEFIANDSFLDAFRDSQKRLYALFSDARNLHTERARVAAATIDIFKSF